MCVDAGAAAGVRGLRLFGWDPVPALGMARGSVREGGGGLSGKFFRPNGGGVLAGWVWKPRLTFLRGVIDSSRMVVLVVV